jgi:peptidoglycan-N-acetylglucosamine deacetylase
MKKKITIGLVAIFLILGISAVLFQISKSRTFQFFGEIYPRVETSKMAVALTFDDGPTKAHTGEILKILRDENIKATFFVMGAEIENHPGELEKIIADGHEVGNHTYHHERMFLVTPSFVKSEIETTDALIRQAGYQHEITFRPPFGKKLFTLPYYLSQNNRKTITWDVEPETFVKKSEDIISHTLEKTTNGSIILLHVAYDSGQESMKSVEPIIKGLKEKGFEFKTVSELLAMKKVE